ncbi:hypothetical protein [Candidatus Chromulinivorax destructor]|uniref:Uncharacterized protein n=1 Tax=Candidatus Chromulinivorax destructor TaxID=2066483 RepID=A0A345ZCR2_9BACT|nr:hypothetical protein [Candidatus Chromulinivorax destructor]AXK61079.1 hypothetical protein C0J27_05095 [Candidatus Chromulinivorax destructor]
MKNLKMFFMRHVGLILTMMAGYTGMNASSANEFEKCLKAKADFLSMCSTGVIDQQFVSHYSTKKNNVYKIAFQTCMQVKYGKDYLSNASYQEDLKREQLFQQELSVDLDNIKKSASQVRCDQLRKDFVTSLASVQSEENKAAVIKAFDKQLAECNV